MQKQFSRQPAGLETIRMLEQLIFAGAIELLVAENSAKNNFTKQQHTPCFPSTL
jgi:hypothetical protein